MDPRRTVSPETAIASDIFDKFCSANTLKGILLQYRNLCQTIRLKPTHFPDFFPRLKAKLSSWRAQGLWAKFEKRASHKCYNRGKACYGSRVLIIGAGPCGLRAAIEAQLLGAKVVVIEKRDRFSRNNVLHLWPFVITDLKALGAKKFYGKFCAGSIDHISIRQIQCILLKVALLLGVEVLEGVSFEGLLEPTENEGWRAKVLPVDHPVSQYNFDVLIGADGRRNTLDGFKRKAMRAKLAIAITANFINKHSEAEARVKEISGVSYIFNQKFFQELNEATGIDLENIVYYKDETHYFVMTAKKQSLLNKGVLLEDHADTAKLLSHENISSEALMTYALEAAIFSTENQLPYLDFAVNHYGQPDVAMFDFTAMYAAENACRVVQRKGHKLLMTLVGDSLLEPFWPTGSGCARGFLSSFDTAWMLRSWSSGSKSVLEVIAERESIYRLLGQTTPENLNKEHLGYTIDPHSRYPNLNLRVVMPFQVKSLYDSDEVNSTDLTDSQGVLPTPDTDKSTKKRRRDSVIAVDSLVAWIRDQVASYGLEICDVFDAFRRGDILVAIINRFRPDLIEFPLPSEENVDPLDIAACRNQIAFDLLHEEHGLPPVMSGFDAVQCTSSDYLAIVAYLSQIYEIFRGEIPQIKYSRADVGDEFEDVEQRSSHSHLRHAHRPTLVVKHGASKPSHRRSRLSSNRDMKSDAESESLRRNKKRKSEERSRLSVEEREARLREIEKNRLDRVRRRMQERMLQTERFIKSMRLLQLNDRSGEIAVENDVNQSYEDYTFYLYRQMAPGFEERCQMLENKLFCPGKDIKSGAASDPEKHNVPGLAKNLEEKLKGGSKVDKKPKDLIRAIGKIEKSDWNIQLIEKKIAENKSHCAAKKDRDDKVPKWSREAFDDKREAMKRKIEGVAQGDRTEKLSQFDESVKKLGSKLREGNVLEVGQRGCNKVSQMANQLVNKMEKPKEEVPKTAIQRPAFEFPKKGGSETCHFCNERVYVVERMTAEGKFFHRNCFRCEYCNTSLRLGNYVFDREGRYGEKFYCTPHYQLIRLYGWKKYDQSSSSSEQKLKYGESSSLLHQASQQMLSEMDERGTTPERVEFENSVDFASEEELLSEMDEDEWTDRNFGVSNADDNNTSDEASDLSDEELTPDGTAGGQIHIYEGKATADKDLESSDSDTEVASGDDELNSEDEEEEDLDDDEEEEVDEEEGDEEDEGEEEDEEEEDCGGSTTEIETDSEFAEDPPHSVPGKIPTIVVDEPEQLVTKIFEAAPVSHTHSPSSNKQHKKHTSSHHYKQDRGSKAVPTQQPLFDDVIQRHIQEPVKKNIPERVLPRVNTVPKKWEPLMAKSDHPLASKLSLELKQKYLQGPVAQTLDSKKTSDCAATNQFRSVLDMISEQQKLLQPAPKPSAAMQAFLEGAEKLKQKQSISPLGSRSPIFESIGGPSTTSTASTGSDSQGWISKELNSMDHRTKNGFDHNDNRPFHLLNMNKLNLEKTKESTMNDLETTGEICRENSSSNNNDVNRVSPNLGTIPESSDPSNHQEMLPPCMTMSDTPSFSQSETETPSTVIGTTEVSPDNVQMSVEGHDGSVPLVELCPASMDYNINGTNASSDIDDDSVTESGDHMSELDLDYVLEDEKEERVTCKPPRVEIEDEFGVTLELEVEANTTSEVKERMEVNGVRAKEVISPEGGVRSGGMSSSDSRDSLNSGIFLETEMSDWTKDTGIPAGKSPAKTAKKKSKRVVPSKTNNYVEPESQFNEIQGSGMALDFSNLDFADIDGISSPEQESDKLPTKQGYSTLTNEAVNAEAEEVSHVIQIESSAGTSSNVSSVDVTPSSAHSIIETNGKDTAYNFGMGDKPSNLVLMDRVIPFSNARDSLDYRKLKSATSSPTKSKDPFSGSAIHENMSSPPSEPEKNFGSSYNHNDGSEKTSQLEQDPETVEETDSLSKPFTSPTTIRKIEEINNERSKQSDLIRSMVMGRIMRSPDKARRSSRGSLSPLATSSSSGSGSSEKLLKQDGSENRSTYISRQGSENSVQSINTNSHIESNSKESDIPPALPSTPPPTSNAVGEFHVSQTEKKTSAFHAGVSHYEPVFTSSPRFRNRPKFDRPFSVYSISVTNPPTPVNPTATAETPMTPDLSSHSHKEGRYKVSHFKTKKQSPSFYRSMPDLSSTTLTPFSIPNASQWEEYKAANLVDREKAREEARARARLKSDQELGLDQSDYVFYKEKLRRKISVPEDDVFDPEAAVVVSSICSQSSAGKIPNAGDTAGTNFAQTNPFLSQERGGVESPTTGESDNAFQPGRVVSQETTETPSTTLSNESDFVHLQLRFTARNANSERRQSPHKAKSFGFDNIDSFPNYFTPTSAPPAPRDSCEAAPNDVSESTRPRSFTFTDCNIGENSRAPTGTDSFYYTTTSPTKDSFQQDQNEGVPSYQYVSSPGLDGQIRSSVNKSKAKSSEMLLDDNSLAVYEPSRGISVPDVSKDLSVEKKPKKSKDRERRRSIIQTFSDFFGGKSSASTSSPGTNSSPEAEKSSDSASNKEKFSLFKLTPKLLQKDRRLSKSREPLSPPQNRSPQGVPNSSNEKGKGFGFSSYLSQPDILIQRLSASPTPFKSSRASLNSRYDSPDSGSLSSYDKISHVSSPPGSTTWNVAMGAPETGGAKDPYELVSQIENIEKQLYTLEQRGVSIEKKLKGEERDDQNRDEGELMEEWFILVRDKTRLKRLEKKLRMEIEESKIAQQQAILQERLEHSLNLSDIQKTPEQKSYEMSLLHELNSLEKQKGSLLAQLRQDMQQLDSEDAALDEKIAASSITPRESNV